MNNTLTRSYMSNHRQTRGPWLRCYSLGPWVRKCRFFCRQKYSNISRRNPDAAISVLLFIIIICRCLKQPQTSKQTKCKGNKLKNCSKYVIKRFQMFYAFETQQWRGKRHTSIFIVYLRLETSANGWHSHTYQHIEPGKLGDCLFNGRLPEGRVSQVPAKGQNLKIKQKGFHLSCYHLTYFCNLGSVNKFSSDSTFGELTKSHTNIRNVS